MRQRASWTSRFSTQGHASLPVPQDCTEWREERRSTGVWQSSGRQHSLRRTVGSGGRTEKAADSFSYKIFLFPKWQVFPTEATHTSSITCPPLHPLPYPSPTPWHHTSSLSAVSTEPSTSERGRGGIYLALGRFWPSTTPAPVSTSSSILKIMQKWGVLGHS